MAPAVHASLLFTDVSLNPKSRCGVGVYLLLPASILELPQGIARTEMAAQVRARRFENTSSTQLEVQTVLWALEEYRERVPRPGAGVLRVYSDSQGVLGLLARRVKLEAKDFIGKRKKKLLKNAGLYRQFYGLYDELQFEIIKVTGHSPARSHDTVHRIFSCVDQQARKELHLLVKDAKHSSIQNSNFQLQTSNF